MVRVRTITWGFIRGKRKEGSVLREGFAGVGGDVGGLGGCGAGGDFALGRIQKGELRLACASHCVVGFAENARHGTLGKSQRR